MHSVLRQARARSKTHKYTRCNNDIYNYICLINRYTHIRNWIIKVHLKLKFEFKSELGSAIQIRI